MFVRLNILILLTISIAKISVGEKFIKFCSENEECEDILDSLCSLPDGHCKCLNNKFLVYIYGKLQCVDDVGYNQNCLASEQCQTKLGGNSECEELTKVCKCREDFHFKDNACHKTSYLYESCASSSNCLALNHISPVCTNYICDCPKGFTSDATGTLCIPGKKLGEDCDDHYDCRNVDNAMCQRTCKCKFGFTPNSNNKYCLYARQKYGEDCEEDIQCTSIKYSYCHREFFNCSCKDTDHLIKNICLETKKLNNICNIDEECQYKPELVDVMGCVENTCQLRNGSSSYGNYFLNGWMMLIYISIPIIIIIIIIIIVHNLIHIKRILLG
ncbi:unnamed protein product [Brassicogethes aeneus]|uniref:EB domain-containing protein n=1 Tax=Brassicogethes aeneus TaxID=1431903 RepID=A0A9P0B9C5_BRAAE|nr:unnamed protein product [Brassicogethes aeneus]